jgi:predicted SAM-dependent methyltransferase
MSMLERLSDAILPRSLSRQIKFEGIAAARFALAKLTSASQFKGQRNLRVNVGCGQNFAAGYINIDLYKGPNVVFWDCRKSLPFDDNSVDIVFAEHVLEHFEYPTQSSTFLKECFRCLSKGGVVRVVVPDGALYLKLYNSGSWEGMIPVRPLIACDRGYKDGWLNEIYKTRMEFINAIFRQGIEHKFIYDGETLESQLKDCGFEIVQRMEFGKTLSPIPALDSYPRKGESLYVEAVKV